MLYSEITALATLREIFPHMDDHVLKNALRKHNNQLDEVVIALTSENALGEVHLKTTRKPKGWNEFSKAIPEKKTSVLYTPPRTSQKIVTVTNQEHFPTLAKTVALHNPMAVECLQSMFPQISDEVILETAAMFRNISEAVEVLLKEKIRVVDTGQEGTQKITPKKKSQTPLAKKPAPAIQKPKQNLNDERLVSQNNFLLAPEFEDDVYLQERKEAIFAVRKRDKLFSQACRAYDAGDHVMAKAYARKGHEANNKYHLLNQEACERIFVARNIHNDLDRIDLHGLQATEAIEKVNLRVELLSSLLMEGNVALKKLEIITGFGKHQNGNPILRLVVQELLEQNKLSFREQTPGKFLVVIPRNFVKSEYLRRTIL